MTKGEFPAKWRDAGGIEHETKVSVWEDSPTPSLPAVLLLHGGGGNIDDMRDPKAHYPGVLCDVDWLPPAKIDRGWHPYPNTLIWGFITSPPKSGPGLQEALANLHYTALNYAQVEPQGSVEANAFQLDGVFRAILQNLPNRRIALVGHCRGGILARYFLQQMRSDFHVLSRIAGVVTLHSPHQGTQAADFAMDMHNAIRAVCNAYPALAPSLDPVDQLVGNPCNAQLTTSSWLLANLRTQETIPLPVAIPIHTFGGTNPRITNLFVSTFDAISALPQWHLPPFHWITSQSLVLNALDGTPVALICPEEKPGGDFLIADARSHLAGEASHHTERQNHANVLCDVGVQSDLGALLVTMRSNAAFVSQSVPTSMIKGTTYPVSITMKNTGTSTWISGVHWPFRLGSQNPQDNCIWGMGRQEVPAYIPPGANVTFNFSVNAPPNAGNYHFQWRMLQEGIEWFGAATPDVVVSVTQAAAATG